MQNIKFVLAATVLLITANVHAQVHKPECATRNNRLKDAYDNAKGTQMECYEQLKKSRDNCSKNPNVSDEDMSSAQEIANKGGAEASWESYAEIHKLKSSKYRDRASDCLDEVANVHKACDRFDVNGKNGADEMIKALNIGADCDMINSQVEDDEEQHARIEAGRIADGKEESKGPGTEKPDAKDYVNGYGKGVTGQLNEEGHYVPNKDELRNTIDDDSVKSKMLAAAKPATLPMLDAISSSGPVHSVIGTVGSSSVPIAGAAWAASKGEYGESMVSGSSAGVRLIGWSTGETVLAAGTAFYMGMTVGAAPSGADDAPLSNANKAISIMSHPGH